MGVTTAIMATTAGSALLSAASNVMTGYSQKSTADANAAVYEAQAKNIESQKSIVASQYRSKKTQLKGEAVATAARQGIKISGSTAQSISQSITQLGIEQSYEQYNLDVQKQQALNNAAYQRYLGKQAVMSGWLNAGTSLLSSTSDYYSKYWKNKNDGVVTCAIGSLY